MSACVRASGSVLPATVDKDQGYVLVRGRGHRSSVSSDRDWRCVEHGFDQVTTDEVAHGIGVSRATFFRYFASKEGAVVSAARGAAERAGTFAQRVVDAAESAAPHTTVWAILRAAAEPMVDTADTRGDPLRVRIRMITDVPAFKGHLASQRRNDQSAVADVLRERLGDDRAANALAAAGIAAVDLRDSSRRSGRGDLLLMSHGKHRRTTHSPGREQAASAKIFGDDSGLQHLRSTPPDWQG
ncbi:TetR/AcrR family transcriptional regulator [Sediminivirga luteola]|uniref:TetR/AcrR family transcriptional regulator n=1 Tax=Sediminivirga luteola TaxID=1774748 RepID=UPI00227D2801|nr:TetR family transcriptional regulator [Sediminivirga luteola]